MDLTGQPYGRWTVLRFIERRDHHSYWLCRCACGTEKGITANSLRMGGTLSCGCLHQDVMTLPREVVTTDDVPLGAHAIPLNHGKVAFIDEADWHLVKDYIWRAWLHHGTWYAVTNVPFVPHRPGHHRMLRLHRLIMGFDFGDPREVDHWDGNGLDNRRQNLRPATDTQNCQNAKPHKAHRRFKGAYARSTSWQASIQVNKQSLALGSFPTEEEAARAYDFAAIIHFGEFARLNFKDSRYLATVEALLSA